MSKRIGKVLCLIFLSVILVLVSACSFFGEEERREIENIYYIAATQDDVEGIFVVIEYAGDEYPDSMFFVANGEEGKEGNGIAEVTGELIEDGAKIQITVKYTDQTRDPSVFEFNNSVFPTDCQSELDPETGDWHITITLSNGEIVELDVHNGVDGDEIIDFRTEPGNPDLDEDENTTYIVIVMKKTDPETGENITYRIPMPEGDKGEQGVGIAGIRVDDYLTRYDANFVHLVIELTDGTELRTEIPKVNNWTVGDGAPSPGSGMVGDFYFDRRNCIFYYRNNAGTWEIIIDLSDKTTADHVVSFMVDGIMLDTPIYIKHGDYFYGKTDKKIPTPQKDGFKFAGWYTKLNEDGTVNVNSGQFTDLTPVLTDMTLYAYFIAETD